MDAAQKYRRSEQPRQQSGHGRLDRETRLKLGLALRAVYKDFAGLNLPRRLTDLLKRLEPRT
jgi:hypothetical protein